MWRLVHNGPSCPQFSKRWGGRDVTLATLANMAEFRLFRSNPDEHVPHERLRALCRRAEQDDSAERIAPHYTVSSPTAEETWADAAVPGEAAPGMADRLRERAGNWLPEAVLNARFDPGRTGLLALSLAVLAGAGVLTVVLWPSGANGPEPASHAAPPRLPPAVDSSSSTRTANSTDTASASGSASESTPAKLVVSVVGRVAEPGLVTVQPGDRVDDALRRAGGPLPDTDVTALNLARRLDDGEQLYVGIPVPARGPGAEAVGGAAIEESTDEDDSADVVDLNTADADELQELSGVGEVTAEQILSWRDEHGEFGSVDQLRDVDGIGSATVERLRDQVRV